MNRVPSRQSCETVTVVTSFGRYSVFSSTDDSPCLNKVTVLHCVAFHERTILSSMATLGDSEKISLHLCGSQTYDFLIISWDALSLRHRRLVGVSSCHSSPQNPFFFWSAPRTRTLATAKAGSPRITDFRLFCEP